MSDNHLRSILEKMDYPINFDWETEDRRHKIAYVCRFSKQYKNEQEVIDFIKNTGNNNFREVFELIYDSDLFKGD